MGTGWHDVQGAIGRSDNHQQLAIVGDKSGAAMRFTLKVIQDAIKTLGPSTSREIARHLKTDLTKTAKSCGRWYQMGLLSVDNSIPRRYSLAPIDTKERKKSGRLRIDSEREPTDEQKAEWARIKAEIDKEKAMQEPPNPSGDRFGSIRVCNTKMLPSGFGTFLQ